ncbi:MAG: hypothetical protein M1834_003764 [Cirrosporium novae-zelandiae]|nr:MAG: hypothetical protein M1834_003764 [Cirrosporium novae-zelandiae]
MSTSNTLKDEPGVVRSGNSSCDLPPEKVFPIQIGSKLFRLSGASIASDAPSYFSKFFEVQLRDADEGAGVRTLYIDRDPITFQDIAQHLQGYHICPRDGTHFVKIFADAQFYSLPRLISQLYDSAICMRIGDRDFCIPKDIFSSPGDSPNFFSLGFAVFFSTPSEVFPGLNNYGLLRPPSILPPEVPNRSADVFAQLLHMLRGYPVQIKNEDHRKELLRDCRYFHLRGLEQKLIAHAIEYNPFRRVEEITIHLEDVRQSGLSICSSNSDSRYEFSTPTPPSTSFVTYARPFVDSHPYDLIIDLPESTTILKSRLCSASPRQGIIPPIPIISYSLTFHQPTLARIASLLNLLATKLNLPTVQPLGLMLLSRGDSGNPTGGGDSTTKSVPAGNILNYNLEHTGLVGSENGGGVKAELFPSNLSDGGAWVELDGAPIGAQDLEAIFQPNMPQNTDRAVMVDVEEPIKKRRRVVSDGGGAFSAGVEEEEWTIRRGLWRLEIRRKGEGKDMGYEIVFVAVKVEAYRGERSWNRKKNFL